MEQALIEQPRESGADDFDRFFEAVSSADRSIGHMHATDCRWIVEQVSQAGPDAIPGVVAFVFTSIQKPFWSIQSRMADVQRNGLQSRFLFGAWRSGLRYASDNRQAIWQTAQDAVEGLITHEQCLREFMRIPGLGMVKASFLCQMLTGEGACLDGINLHRLGLKETHFKTNTKWSEKTLQRKISEYIATWSRIGDSRYWWDTWCEFQGTRSLDMRGYRIRSPGGPEAVSTLHRDAINMVIGRVISA